jgi:RNA-directed DNA polymerase
VQFDVTVPTIRDRVVQTAVKLVIEPNTYGYRPNRSAVDAIKQVKNLLWAGHTDVVDADLSKYFDTIAHNELIQCVARRIVDRTILSLIKMWLKAPVEERDKDGTRRMTGGKNSRHGTPQGGVISPLLANLYINRFLKFWRMQEKTRAYRAHIVSYADDFVILSRGHAGEALAWTRGVMLRLPHPQRGENLAEGCPQGAVRLPWLHVRPALAATGWQAVSGLQSIEEKHRSDQGQDRRPTGAGQPGLLG